MSDVSIKHVRAPPSKKGQQYSFLKSGSLVKYIGLVSTYNCYSALTTSVDQLTANERYCNNSPSFLHIKAVFSQRIFTYQDLHVHKQKGNMIGLLGRSHDHSHLSHPPPHLRFSPVTSSLALPTTPSREPVHTDIHTCTWQCAIHLQEQPKQNIILKVKESCQDAGTTQSTPGLFRAQNKISYWKWQKAVWSPETRLKWLPYREDAANIKIGVHID